MSDRQTFFSPARMRTRRLMIGTRQLAISMHDRVSFGDPVGMYVNGLPASMPLLQQISASGASQSVFTAASTRFAMYFVRFFNVVPATNNVACNLRFSSDGGSTLRSGSEYTGALIVGKPDATSAALNVGGTALTISGVLSNAHGRAVDGWAWVVLGSINMCWWKVHVIENGGVIKHARGSGYDSATTMNAFGFIMSSGNHSGLIGVWGLPAS